MTPAIATLFADYDERVLPSIVNEVLKGVVAQYNAASLLTNRETVSLTIRRNLRERAREFNIIMEDVSITELHFGHEFTQAVEAKQVGTSDTASRCVAMRWWCTYTSPHSPTGS